MTPITNILRANLDGREQLNILCFFLDGKFEDILVRTGHNIFGAKESFISSYPVECAAVKYLPLSVGEIPRHLVFDLVIYNHFESQQNKAHMISNISHIPRLAIQHFATRSTQIRFKDEIVFVHQYIKDSLGVDGQVINYGIQDNGESDQERDIDVLIHGDFLSSDYYVLQFTKQLQCKVEIYGNSPGLSPPISQDELVQKAQRSKIFLNLSTHSGVPHSALVAMMNGCAIISNSNIVTPHLFPETFSTLVEHTWEFAPAINKLLDGPWKEGGKLAREYAISEFSMDVAVAKWKAKLRAKANEVYTR